MDEEDSDLETLKEVTKTWQGTSITDICKGKGHWLFAVSPVIPSQYHCVLYEMPVTLDAPPEPHYTSQSHLWDDNHVRMPYSTKNLFPISEEDFKQRWSIIKEALSRPISSSYEFEAAVGKYNNSLPKFEALHYFFNEALDEDESKPFFENVLPKIIQLALKLPKLVPCGIPLLQKYHNRSLSLSQLQIACLLANAFLCTFPWRKNVAQVYPGVNMVGLFSSFARPKRKQCICEKLKCLCNYFRRVTQNYPLGVVTFERKFLHRSAVPRWDKEQSNLGNTRVHISSTGTIEDNGFGFLQVDFANKNVGGGVLRYGCVQEEIRFVICPELIISRLFVEQLENTEAVIITGAERYNNYTGYGDTFEWNGNCNDNTPIDVYGRRRTTICVIDATRFIKPKEQFHSALILRELNKAYVGFSSREKDKLAPVATGNWGCGAFKGSKQLKTLIQLMACCATNRDLVYYSFGDEELMENFYQMHLFLANNRITIAQLWRFLCRFSMRNLSEDELYAFIQQAYFDDKKQPTISQYFNKQNECTTKEKPPPSVPSTSAENRPLYRTTQERISCKKIKKDEDAMDTIEEFISSSSSEDIIPSSQPEPKPFKKSNKLKQKRTPEDISKKLPKTDVLDIFEMLDGNANQSEKFEDSQIDQGVLTIFDTFTVERITIEQLKGEENRLGNKETSHSDLEEVVIDLEEKMEVDDRVVQSSQKELKKKITDYFNKTSK